MDVRVFDKHSDLRARFNLPEDANEYDIKTAIFYPYGWAAKRIFIGSFMGKPYAKVWI